MSAEETPRRLTPTEKLHEVTMAAMSRRPSEPESSVTISRNAKGVAQFEVTVRGGDASACLIDAEDIFAYLERRFPYPVEAPVSPLSEAPAPDGPNAGHTAQGAASGRRKAAAA